MKFLNSIFFILNILLMTPSSHAYQEDIKNSLLEDLKLHRQFLPHPTRFYSWYNRPRKLYRKAPKNSYFTKHFQENAKRFDHRLSDYSYQEIGPGVYAFTDPIGSMSFGFAFHNLPANRRENWVLLEIRAKMGTAYLDLRQKQETSAGRPALAISLKTKQLIERRIGINLQNLKSINRMGNQLYLIDFVLLHQYTHAELVSAIKLLKINMIAYNWNISHPPKYREVECQQSSTSFLFINQTDSLIYGYIRSDKMARKYSRDYGFINNWIKNGFYYSPTTDLFDFMGTQQSNLNIQDRELIANRFECKK